MVVPGSREQRSALSPLNGIGYLAAHTHTVAVAQRVRAARASPGRRARGWAYSHGVVQGSCGHPLYLPTDTNKNNNAHQ